MTFIELLGYIGSHCKYDVMDGDIDTTLALALDGKHKNPVVGNIIAQMYKNSGIANAAVEIDRAQAINTLGPIRLFYMKDDAPVEGFRLVEDIVHKIDGAFNDEAMRLKD
ncbi:MAG: hypothetical protein P4L77_00790 [Sulfuriferula sp.]|jgi:hypothetical protein|nr:hypothetical protein [Sulfuriferula sp.]